jgi:hypothetical protein
MDKYFAANIKKWKKFIKKIYKYGNGKINPKYKCRKLIIHEEVVPRLLDDDSPSFIGACLSGDEIHVYLSDIMNELKLCENVDITIKENKFKAFLAGIIFHELSHCDQHMPLFPTDDERRIIEYQNELNTYYFVKRYRDEIFEKFDGIDIRFYFDISQYMEELNGKTDLTIPAYKKIANPIEKMYNVISHYTLMDVEGLCNELGYQ